MSVSGEFQRCLRECLDLLETAAPGGGAPWAAALREAAARGRENLSAGAERWLEARAGLAGTPPRFGAPPDGDLFEARLDHVSEICRVILGR